MVTGLPLSALLSQALVAFIIEFDNEFEKQVPHRTTNFGSTPGFSKAPWLVSMAMWVRYMQYIPEDGISFNELQERSRISNKGLQTWLTRLSKWWSYLSVTATASGRIPADAIIRPTSGGIRAIRVWRGLTGVIETRWRERFGSENVVQLKQSLAALADRLGADAPDFFAVLEYGSALKIRPAQVSGAELTLPQLLSKALIAFASEFDGESKAPIAVCANLLRLTGDAGVLMRDLPRLACLSKEGTAAAVRMGTRHGCGGVRTDAVSRSKSLLLTSKGRMARDAYAPLGRAIETRWQERFGGATIRTLREMLQELAGDDPGAESPLLRGLKPYPDGWRAFVAPMEGLPHFPMISHRGGFPDGS